MLTKTPTLKSKIKWEIFAVKVKSGEKYIYNRYKELICSTKNNSINFITTYQNGFPKILPLAYYNIFKKY